MSSRPRGGLPPHLCDDLEQWLEDDELPVEYSARLREYYIDWPSFRQFYTDMPDTAVEIVLNYCPRCGARLPTSLRTEWAERVAALGLDPSAARDDPSLPSEMRTDEWWRAEGP